MHFTHGWHLKKVQRDTRRVKAVGLHMNFVGTSHKLFFTGRRKLGVRPYECVNKKALI